MAESQVERARTGLVNTVRDAIPAVRQSRASGSGGLVPPAEGEVTSALLRLLSAMKETGALDTRSKRELTTLPISNGELGELVVTFEPDEGVSIRRQSGELAEAFVPGAGGTSLLLLAVADRLAREVSAGNLMHEKAELRDSIALLNEQGQLLAAERR
jgi:hypothetical protein